MSSVSLHPPRPQLDVITIKPDVILAVVALGGLLFVPVLRSAGALVFLACGSALVARRLQFHIQLSLKYWYILALPIFCLLSSVWSEYPALTFRFSLQLMATVGIAISIASAVSARVFCQTLFALYSLAMLASLLFGDVRNDTGAWLGIYGSKNALAGAAATYVIICAAKVLDGSASSRYRLLAGVGLMGGLVLLLLAQSLSALLIVPPSLLILFLLLVLYRLSPLQQVTVMIFAALASIFMMLLVVIFSDALFAIMLQTTGKDVTLTGRTELWRIAVDLIAERPFFGMGYQAFWVKGHGAAEVLWYTFGIESRSGFNFHNTYLSNAVEIGLAGVALQIIILYGAAIAAFIWALRRRSAEASLLFVLVMMVVMVSFVEVPIFFQFSLRSVIVICVFVFALRGLSNERWA